MAAECLALNVDACGGRGKRFPFLRFISVGSSASNTAGIDFVDLDN